MKTFEELVEQMMLNLQGAGVDDPLDRKNIATHLVLQGWTKEN